MLFWNVDCWFSRRFCVTWWFIYLGHFTSTTRRQNTTCTPFTCAITGFTVELRCLPRGHTHCTRAAGATQVLLCVTVNTMFYADYRLLLRHLVPGTALRGSRDVADGAGCSPPCACLLPVG
jgi:hypothetical protein